jgi:hypothetical protein
MSNELSDYVEIKDPQLKSLIRNMVSAYEGFKACHSYANAQIKRHLYEEGKLHMKIYRKIFLDNLGNLLRLNKRMELMINTIEGDE